VVERGKLRALAFFFDGTEVTVRTIVALPSRDRGAWDLDRPSVSPQDAAALRAQPRDRGAEDGPDPYRAAPVPPSRARADDPPAQRDRALLLLGYAGAFRRSELVALDVGDLRFSANACPARVCVPLRRSSAGLSTATSRGTPATRFHHERGEDKGPDREHQAGNGPAVERDRAGLRGRPDPGRRSAAAWDYRI